MRIDPPTPDQLAALMGPKAQAAWNTLLAAIEAEYEMETQWATGGKAGPYEYKYRRGGKTLCALYPRQGSFGFMVVLGRAEQEKFEALCPTLSPATTAAYDATTVYHDGRWLMLDVTDDTPQPDMMALLHLKRRPNRK